MQMWNKSHLQAPPVDGGLEEAHDLLALDPGAVEGLGPGDESGGHQALLLQREGEGEAEAELLLSAANRLIG